MNSISVKFFTDAGSKVGLGHLTRNIAIANALLDLKSDVKVTFFVNSEPLGIPNQNDISFKFVNWTDLSFLKENIHVEDICVVDSYKVTEKQIDYITQNSRDCFFLDDLGIIKYPRGTVINPGLHIPKISSYTNPNCRYLLGSNYIILRKEFLNLPRKIQKDVVKEILIVFGGSDLGELVTTVCKRLTNYFGDINFSVVVGSKTKTNSLAKIENLQVFRGISSTEIRDLMLKCDLCITGAGQTLYELIATDSVFIPIQIISNQQENVIGIKNINPKISVLDINSTTLIKDLILEVESKLPVESRIEFSEIFTNKIDGYGSKRIAKEIVNMRRKIDDNIFIEKATLDYLKPVFKLSNSDYVRKYSISKSKITWDAHRVWFSSIIESSNDVFHVVLDEENNFLGQVRFNMQEETATVSISLTEQLLGKGKSKQILHANIEFLFREYIDIKQIDAFISPENKASLKLFQSLGFTKVSTGVNFHKFELRRKL